MKRLVETITEFWCNLRNPKSCASQLPLVQLLSLTAINFSQGVMLTMPFTVAVFMTRDFLSDLKPPHQAILPPTQPGFSDVHGAFYPPVMQTPPLQSVHSESLLVPSQPLSSGPLELSSSEHPVDEQTVSRLTGLLAASYRLGRKPILNLGNLACLLGILWFGASGSYSMAIASRIFSGTLNGIIGAWKCIIGESGDSLVQGKMFGYMSLSWGLGCICGPLIGGVASRPCDKNKAFPLCGRNQWNQERPYFFACFCGSLTILLASVLTLIFLEETLPALRNKKKSVSDPKHEFHNTNDLTAGHILPLSVVTDHCESLDSKKEKTQHDEEHGSEDRLMVSDCGGLDDTGYQSSCTTPCHLEGSDVQLYVVRKPDNTSASKSVADNNHSMENSQAQSMETFTALRPDERVSFLNPLSSKEADIAFSQNGVIDVDVSSDCEAASSLQQTESSKRQDSCGLTSCSRLSEASDIQIADTMQAISLIPSAENICSSFGQKTAMTAMLGEGGAPYKIMGNKTTVAVAATLTEKTSPLETEIMEEQAPLIPLTNISSESHCSSGPRGEQSMYRQDLSKSVRLRLDGMRTIGSRVYYSGMNPFLSNSQGDHNQTTQQSQGFLRMMMHKLLGYKSPDRIEELPLIGNKQSACNSSSNEDPAACRDINMSKDVECKRDDVESSLQLVHPSWYKNRQILLCIGSYGITAFLFCAMDEIFPLYAATSTSQGGLGMNESQVALPLISFGVVLMIYSAWGYPPMQRVWGTQRLCQAGHALVAVVCMMLPLVATSRNAPPLAYIILYGCMGLRALGQCCSFNGCMIMVNAAPPPEQLGEVNGAGQMLASFVRGAGPALAGVIWAGALSLNSPGQQFLAWAFASFVAIIGSVMWGTMTLANLKM